MMLITFKKSELNQEFVDKLEKCLKLLSEVERKEEYKLAKTYKSWFKTKICHVPVEKYDRFFFWDLPLGEKDLVFYVKKTLSILEDFCAVPYDKLITLDIKEWNSLRDTASWYDKHIKGDEICK